MNDTSETVQKRTVRYESSNDSTRQLISTTSEAVDVSETNFNCFGTNISTTEDSDFKLNEHVIQQEKNTLDTSQNGIVIHESSNVSIWQSTIAGAEDIPHSNFDINISTAEHANMIAHEYVLQTTDKDSSHENEGIFLERNKIVSEVSMKSEVSDLGTSEKDDEVISINDETGNQTAISGNETPKNVIQKVTKDQSALENAAEEVIRNVESARNDKITTKEITDKFVESSSLKNKNCDKEDRRHDNVHLAHVTSVDKEGHVNHQLSNATSLVGRDGSPRTHHHSHHHSHHVTTVACGDESVATGKVNYAIFPNTDCHILHKDITDDQLQRYLEDELYESMTKESLSAFKENQVQEVNLDDFVEISLEVKL